MTHDIAPRFGDMDPLRHLNNAALARIYEDARVRFIDRVGLRGALRQRDHFVVAQVTIHYLAEGRYPDMLSVGSGVLRTGGSAFALAQALFQNGGCIGTCETVLVHVCGASKAPQPLPDAARTILQSHRLNADGSLTHDSRSREG